VQRRPAAAPKGDNTPHGQEGDTCPRYIFVCLIRPTQPRAYRRLARRRGGKKAMVAVGRSILVIVWQLLSNPDTQFRDLGPDFYANRLGADRTKRNHIRQLEALGYKVTLEPAA